MKPLVFIALFSVVTASHAFSQTWYRGNTHTHSLWSDGNDFPEMITEWYVKNGYDFMALSDHNVLARGEKWMSVAQVNKRQKAKGPSAMEKYLARFKDQGWIETRDHKGIEQVRLRTLEEYRPLFEKPGEFLIIEAEEISAQYKSNPIHLNAVNIQEVIPAVKGDSVRDVMRKNLQAIIDQEKATGEPILAHMNHPNFHWAITAEDIAHVLEEKFFEVYNGHPSIRHLGDENHPGDEMMWDIANTIRIAELKEAPLLAVATDDSHHYHGGDASPGRGWVMVRSEKLEPKSLIAAMRAGDFYSSTGVFLDEITWNKETREISMKIKADGDRTFTAELIGTRKNHQSTAQDGETGVGEVFVTEQGTNITFKLPDDALYGRVTITSNAAHPNPSFNDQKKQAWTQPVGWR